MKRKLILFALFGATILVALNSCEAKVDLNDINTEMEVETALAAPIGTISATLGDLLDIGSLSQHFAVVDDTLMYMRKDTIHAEFHPIDLRQYISASTKSISFQEHIPAALQPVIQTLGYVPAGSELTIPLNMPIHLNGINADIRDERIDSARIDSACFTTTITSTDLNGMLFSDIQKLTMLLPTQTFKFQNKTPNADGMYEIDIPVQGRDFGQEIPINLDDFTLTLMNPDKSVSDSLKIQFQFELKTGNNITISNQSALMYKMEVLFLDYSVIYGYFLPSDLLSSTNSISLFGSLSSWENFKKLNLPVTEPRLELHSWTTVGAPITFSLAEMYAYSEENPATKVYADFSGNRSYDWNLLNFPTITDPLGTVKTNNMTFDNKFGHIDNLFTVRPDVIAYSYRANINRNYYDIQHRLERDNMVNIETDIIIPFRFNPGVDIWYVDTITGINIGSISVDSITEDIDEIKKLDISEARLILNTESYIPFNVIAAIDLRDQYDQPVKFKLDDQQGDTIVVTIPGPTDEEYYTDAQGHVNPNVLTPRESTITWVIDNNDLDELSKADHAYVSLRIAENTMRCYAWATSRLTIKLGVAAKAGAVIDPFNQ